jgi:hypothetical protein
MITRSLSRLRPPMTPPGQGGEQEGHRRPPKLCSGAEAQGHLPPLRRGQVPGSGGVPARIRRYARKEVERATVANNYWSSTTNANNPNNAWNVNFNNGNNNNWNNKNNTLYVRAVRGGSWSVLRRRMRGAVASLVRTNAGG